MIYLQEVLFLMANIAIADYHAHQFAVGKSINHTFWAAVIGALIVGGWLVQNHNYIFATCLLLERIWCFNPILNLFRGKSFWYTNSGNNGSWIDAHIGDAYPYIFLTALAAFITLNFFV